MKTTAISPILAGIALITVSCDRSDEALQEKLSRLEQAADQAIQRQADLEEELAQNKLAAEVESIERERAEIERQRQELEDAKGADDAASLARAEAQQIELEKRQQELEAKETAIAANRAELERQRLELTGLEDEFDQREIEKAGREPIPSFTSVNVVSQGAPTGDFENFYEPLSQYGSWFETSDYGYVYQPAVVNQASWRPYTRGRWAFTDQGWTWVSDEPFGWATYHYGRWALLDRTGWVWIPGSEWAPAWVSWRENPEYVGWAPLPPETIAYDDHSYGSSVDVTFGIGQSWFSFVSYKNFGNDIRSHYLPVARNHAIYDSCRNVTHYSSRDRRVFVGGPGYQQVSHRIGRRFPVHRLRLDPTANFGRGVRDFHPRFEGRDLRVAAPRMDARWNHDLRPQRVRGTLTNVTVDRSRAISPIARQKFQRRRQQEITEAQRAVREMGGSAGFQRARQDQLEAARLAQQRANRSASGEVGRAQTAGRDRLGREETAEQNEMARLRKLQADTEKIRQAREAAEQRKEAASKKQEREKTGPQAERSETAEQMERARLLKLQADTEKIRQEREAAEQRKEAARRSKSGRKLDLKPRDRKPRSRWRGHACSNCRPTQKKSVRNVRLRNREKRQPARSKEKRENDRTNSRNERSETAEQKEKVRAAQIAGRYRKNPPGTRGCRAEKRGSQQEAGAGEYWNSKREIGNRGTEGEGTPAQIEG